MFQRWVLHKPHSENSTPKPVLSYEAAPTGSGEKQAHNGVCRQGSTKQIFAKHWANVYHVCEDSAVLVPIRIQTSPSFFPGPAQPSLSSVFTGQCQSLGEMRERGRQRDREKEREMLPEGEAPRILLRVSKRLLLEPIFLDKIHIHAPEWKGPRTAPQDHPSGSRSVF